MFNSWDGPASGADSNDTVGTGDGITTNGGLNPNRNHTRDGKDALAAIAMDVASKPNASSSSSSSSSSASKRRERSESNIDDLLSAITNKMGTADLKDSKQQLVDAFIEVMQCSGMEAEFYLESSMMDIATAISLCMDVKKEGERFEHTGAYRSSNNGSDNHGKRHRGDSDSSISAKYTGRQLDIGDLPDGWIAHVDKYTGQVVFLHYSSGVSQYTVPPGYDDIPDNKVDFDKINSNDEELSMDDDTLLPSAENMESITNIGDNNGDDDVIMKTGTEDTDGSGLSSVPLGRVDAFDQHDDNDDDL